MVTGPLLGVEEGPPQACKTVTPAKSRTKRERGKKPKLFNSLCITHLLVDCVGQPVFATLLVNVGVYNELQHLLNQARLSSNQESQKGIEMVVSYECWNMMSRLHLLSAIIGRLSQ